MSERVRASYGVALEPAFLRAGKVNTGERREAAAAGLRDNKRKGPGKCWQKYKEASLTTWIS